MGCTLVEFFFHSYLTTSYWWNVPKGGDLERTERLQPSCRDDVDCNTWLLGIWKDLGEAANLIQSIICICIHVHVACIV